MGDETGATATGGESDPNRLTSVEAAELMERLRAGVVTAETWLKAIGEVATKAATAASKIADDQSVIATKTEHIEDARKHADGVRADLDRAVVAVNKLVADAEGAETRTQSAADSASELQAAMVTKKGTADEDAAVIATAKSAAESVEAALKAMLIRATDAEKRVADYEERLASLEAQCKAQLQTITELLPGATSAGLAFAFDSRRKTFTEPSKRWQWLFVGSLVALVVLAGTGFYSAQHSDATYDTLWRLWLARLPIAAALVWLALHAARESALAKRLEEDYGYKAAIAASFLGFNEQMSKIAEKVKPDTPLAKLCGDTLETIGSPPGRIYDKHALTTTPGKEFQVALEAFAKKIEAGKPS